MTLAELDRRMKLAILRLGTGTKCPHMRGGLDFYSLVLSGAPEMLYCRACIEAVAPQYGCDGCGLSVADWAFEESPWTWCILTREHFGSSQVQDHFLALLCPDCDDEASELPEPAERSKLIEDNRAEILILRGTVHPGPKVPVLEFTEKQRDKLTESIEKANARAAKQ